MWREKLLPDSNIAKINTNGNEEEVKDAFLQLSDGTLSLDERELDRFLRGKGDLTL